MIFIERDNPLSKDQINDKLEILQQAIENEDDDKAREALRSVVPTYKRPDEVNRKRAIELTSVKEYA